MGAQQMEAQPAEGVLARTPVRKERVLQPERVNRVEHYTVRAGDVIKFKQQDPTTLRGYDCRVKILEVGQKHVKFEYEDPYGKGKKLVTLQSDGSTMFSPGNAVIEHMGGLTTTSHGRVDRSANIQIRITVF